MKLDIKELSIQAELKIDGITWILSKDGKVYKEIPESEVPKEAVDAFTNRDA